MAKSNIGIVILLIILAVGVYFLFIKPNQCFNGVECIPPILTEQLCTQNGGLWNECGSRCQIDNQGKPEIACPAVCGELCECGTIAGLNCPPGYYCKMPSGIIDAKGYCIK